MAHDFRENKLWVDANRKALEPKEAWPVPPPPRSSTAFVTTEKKHEINDVLDNTLRTYLGAITPQQKKDVLVSYISDNPDISKNINEGDPLELSVTIESLKSELEQLKVSCGKPLDEEGNQLDSDTISKTSWDKLYAINTTFCTRALISGIGTANAAWKLTQGDMTNTPNKCSHLCHERSKGWKEALTKILAVTKNNDILGYIASGMVLQNTIGFGLDKLGLQKGGKTIEKNDLTELDKINKTYATRSIIQTISLGNSAWKKTQFDLSISSGTCGPLCEKRSKGWRDAIQTILNVTKNNNLLGYLGLVQTGINNTGFTLDTAHNVTRNANAVATSAAKTVGLLEKDGKLQPKKKGWFFGGSRKRRNTRKRHTRRSKYA